MSQIPDEHLTEVRILGLPVPLRERSSQHGDELVREMTLIAAQVDAGDSAHIPDRLVRLAAEVQSTYATFTVNANAQMDAAAEAGIEVIDEIVYRVPREVGPLCAHILTVIAETDAYCADGHYLLALATPPDVRAYQQWILGEFIRQIDGQAPLSWEDFRAQVAPAAD